MRLSIALSLLIIIAFLSGCVNMYSAAINENCIDKSKYPSAYYQSECMLKKSHYYAAFGDPGNAIAQCNAIKDLIDPGLFSTGSNLIGLNHEVEMYNNCVEDTAVQSLDDSYCYLKKYPNVYSSIQNILSIGNKDESFVKSCKDKVNFANQRVNSLPHLMSNFTYLMTNAPNLGRFNQYK